MKQFLKDIAIIGAGQGAPQGEENYCNDGIPFVKAGNLQELLDGKDISLIQQVSEIVAKKHRLKLYSKGTILFAKSGMSCMKGYVYVLPQDAYVVSHLACITPNEQISEYLRYYFLYHKPNQLVKDASYPSISLTDIGNLEIDIKSVAERTAIVNELNMLDSIISLRQRELQKLDDLIKARFVEMFGDPILNPLGWDVKPVIDICDCMVPGRDKPKSFSGIIPWITIDDLMVNSITLKSKQGLGLTEEEISEVKRKTIPVGSVVMSCVGNLGICSIAGTQMIINQQLHSFQCHSEINNIFLMYYLGQRKDYMEQKASSTTVLYMNKAVCNSIPVMIPKLELQEEFAGFVKQVDKSKVVEMNLAA